MRVNPAEYLRIDLRAHSLLADVPLHDVWSVELPGGAPGLTLTELRKRVSGEKAPAAKPAVRFLFGLRTWLGRIFGWDREPPRASAESFEHRLTDAERKTSLVPPGTQEGLFTVLLVNSREAISEIQNSTVHAFSVQALLASPTGYRLYWAIYVRPVGRVTTWYMHLIDPFRRFIIYPAVLRHTRAAWERTRRSGE